MSEEEDAQCVICCEGACDVALPGCGHRFHTACILSHAQYDVKCPVCRRTPDGVRARAREADAVVYVATLDDLPSELIAGWRRGEEEDDGERDEWIRYRTRRRRCLNRDPRLLADFNRLRDLRRSIQERRGTAETRYKLLCRDVWRRDETIRAHIRTIERLRRQERRLERRVHDDLLERIGPEPESA